MYFAKSVTIVSCDSPLVQVDKGVLFFHRPCFSLLAISPTVCRNRLSRVFFSTKIEFVTRCLHAINVLY